MIDTKELNKIESNQQIEIESNKTIFSEWEKKATLILISNDNDFGSANELLKKVKDKIKDIELFRKELVKPLNDYVDNLNAGFKPFKQSADKIKEVLESKILDYNRKRQEELRRIEEEKRQEELKRLQKEKELAELNAQFSNKKSDEIKIENIENKIDKTENKELKIDTGFKTPDVKMSIRKEWTYEILDFEKIDRKYCSPDPQKIKEAIKQGIREIPGLRIFEKESIIQR